MRANSIIAVVATGLILAGCAFAPRETIISTAFDYNLAFERSQNEMMLLNVLRGTYRRPMFFTSINAMRGSMSSTIGTGNVSLQMGPGASNIYTANPSLSYQSSPSFDVTVLDSKSFWLGITKPVPLLTLRYYLEQGWPQDMVLHMFIRKIEISDPNDVTRVTSIENYPSDSGEMTKFRDKLNELFACVARGKYDNSDKTGPWTCRFRIEPDNSDVIGVPFGPDNMKDFDKMANVDKASLKIEQIKDCPGNFYHLVPKQRNYNLLKWDGESSKPDCPKISEKTDTQTVENTTITKETGPEGKRTVEKTKITSTKQVPQSAHSMAEAERASAEKIKSAEILRASCVGLESSSSCLTRIYLRSPAAMLYYLGEVARAYIRPDKGAPRKIEVQYCKNRAEEAPLFFLRKATDQDSDSIVSVTYDNQRYVVPKDEGEYCSRPLTMETMTLLLQLFAQQKEGSEGPVTGAVTVVGGTAPSSVITLPAPTR